jgi:ferrous iron transport protein A
MKKGKLYRIHSVEEDNSFAGRIKKMGFVKDALISLASGNISDPIVVEIRNSRIALRRKEARIIKVRELQDETG